MAARVDAAHMAIEAATKRKTFVRYPHEGPLPRVWIALGHKAGANPGVTIIIPTAGGARARTLAELLAQIEGQTFQQFEVIVVEGDSRQGRAINMAAAIARGDILVTMDDDTRLGPSDLLKRIVNAFATNNTIGIVGVSNLIPSDAPWIVRRAMRELPRRSSHSVSRITDSDMAEHPCLAIRKEVFYRVGGEHELIPRGLDPYLRREVRRLGYRVVVIPNAWIHHLLPPTVGGILRQYFRNGLGAAYVRKFYPEFVIDQATGHLPEIPRGNSFSTRVVRYLGRLALAPLAFRWIYMSTLISYALGYAWGMCSLKVDSR